MQFRVVTTLLVLFLCRVGVAWEPTFWIGGGSSFDNNSLVTSGGIAQISQVQQELYFDPGLMLTSGLTLTLTPQLALNIQAGFLKNKTGFCLGCDNNFGGNSVFQDRRGRGADFHVELTSIDISPMVRAYLTQSSPSVYVGGGVNVSYLLQCKFYQNIGNQRSGAYTYNEQASNCLDNGVQQYFPRELKSMELGLLIGGGVSSMYSESLYISLDVAYKYGLTSLNESNDIEVKRNSIIALFHVGIPI